MMAVRDDNWNEEPQFAAAPAAALSYAHLINVLRRFKWMILGATAACTIAAGYIGTQITPTYTASASVIIEPRQNQVVDLQKVVSDLATDEFTVATQMALLTSPKHIELVMNSLDLFNDPDFNPDRASARAQSSFGDVIPPAQALLPDPRDNVEAAPGGEKNAAREAAIQRFASDLDVRQEGKSYVLSVSFTSPDPGKAALIANQTVKIFVEQARADKLDATSEATGWLGERVAAMREELTAAEGAVEQFRAQNKLFDTREGSVSLDSSELLALNTELIGLRTEIVNLSATLALVERKRNGGESLEDVPEIGNAPTILKLRQDESALLQREAELSTTYGPRHPNMVVVQNEKAKVAAKIEQETQRIIQAMNNTMQLLQSHQDTIESQIDGLRNKDTAQSKLSIRLRELEREAAASRELYDTFLQRFKETREQQALVQADVRLVSQAAPPNSPSSPGPKVFAAVGFTVSFMGSSLIALFASRLNNGVREAGPLKQALGLSTVCTVPFLKLKGGLLPHRYLVEKPLSAYAESVRSVYLVVRDNLGLQAQNSAQAAKVVLVTSSLPSEGKSTFALSLATLFAQHQHRAVIIDLDVRHPSIHKNFTAAPRAGIIEYIANETLSVDDVINKDVVSGLNTVLVQGEGPQKQVNPIALMESQRLKELFRALRREYDIVIIDSPPLLGVIETRMATAFADGALFVVGWGKVDIETAQEAMEYLRRAQTPILSAVLTQVDMTKQGKYYNDKLAKHYNKFEKYYIN